MTSTELTEDEVRRALAGRYEIEGLLGRGGMGLVYLARDLRLERPVALKVPPLNRVAEPGYRDRFLREARTAAALAHPNIVPIHAVHEVGNLIFLVMAYVAGATLARRILEDGPLAPADAARLLRELADALAYAHARGVVHRDVKPDNILLDAATGRTLLSDFGIALVRAGDGPGPVASGDGSKGAVLGTAAFMSPEQARGEPVDARSDLYALGVVGYYALTGRLPFTGQSDAAVIAMHCTMPPPPLAVPGVPHRLAAAVHRCLAKQPATRFPDGAALGRALASALPSEAPPPIAVRAFLTRSVHLAGPALLYEAVLGVVVIPLAVWSWVNVDPGPIQLWASAGLAATLAAPLGVAWARARRLLADGHGWADLVDALAAERERRGEELRFVYGPGPSPVERAMQWVSRLATGAALALAVTIAIRPWFIDQAGARAGVVAVAGAALLAAVVARSRTELRTDPRGQRRLRFWSGPIGRWIFRLAVLGRRRSSSLAPDLQGLVTPG